MKRLQSGEYDVRLNGVDIHYTVRGEGPVLLAHSGGPGMDARGWDDFAGIGAFCTVVAIHPRGSGLSGAAEGDAYLLPDYVADLKALRNHIGVERPVVIGWSHGGMVAQMYAFTHPAALSRLILYDTAAYFGEFLEDVEAAVQAFAGEPWFDSAFAALQKEWAGEYETDEDMRALWAEEIRFYFKRYDARAEAYRQRTAHLPLHIAPLKVFNEQEAETMDLRPHLRNISVPTLIIVGRHDFITNVAMAEEMARHIPKARLVVFEDSGHFASVEEPARFREVVRDFIGGG